jgi:hypothetical protein
MRNKLKLYLLSTTLTGGTIGSCSNINKYDTPKDKLIKATAATIAGPITVPIAAVAGIMTGIVGLGIYTIDTINNFNDKRKKNK